MALVALGCGVGGPVLDAYLVGGIQRNCGGDLNAPEKFAGFLWLMERVPVFGVIAFVSILFVVLLDVASRRFAFLGWCHGGRALLLSLTLAIAASALIVFHDVHAAGLRLC
ncbi:hypothetical protein ACQP2K_35450 [Microbispora siamensis]